MFLVLGTLLLITFLCDHEPCAACIAAACYQEQISRRNRRVLATLWQSCADYIYRFAGPTPFIYPFPRAVFLLMYLKIFEPLVWLRRCAIFGLVVVFTYYWTTAIILLVWTAPTPGQVSDPLATHPNPSRPPLTVSSPGLTPSQSLPAANPEPSPWQPPASASSSTSTPGSSP
jgi:hypothetical protein